MKGMLFGLLAMCMVAAMALIYAGIEIIREKRRHKA